MGSKKEVFKLRSVRSIVIAPARTGRERRRRMTVINTLQTNNGIRSKVIVSARILMTVDIKLMAPRIDEAPAK